MFLRFVLTVGWAVTGIAFLMTLVTGALGAAAFMFALCIFLEFQMWKRDPDYKAYLDAKAKSQRQ